MQRDPTYANYKLPKLFSEIIIDDDIEFKSQYQSLIHESKKHYIDLIKNSQELQKKKQIETQIMELKVFKLGRDVYKAFLQNYRNGDITYVQFENQINKNKSNLIFFGTNYNNFPLKNLYKSLNLIKPDIILTQIHPDIFNQQIISYIDSQNQSQFKNFIDDEYMSYLYCKQDSFNQNFKQSIINELLKSGIIADSFTYEDLQEEEDISKSIYYDTQRINNQILQTAMIWSEQHKKDIIFGDVPLQMLKQFIINEQSLTELELIFEQISYQGYLHDQSQFNMILEHYPDIFLYHSDKYIAQILQKLTEKYQNIFIICGYGQTRSIPYYLHFNPIKDKQNIMKEQIEYKNIFSTFVRKDTLEVQIDKLALIDLIINNNMTQNDFQQNKNIVNNMIQQLNESQIDNQHERIYKLYQTLQQKKYKQILNEQRKYASQNLQKQVKKVIRDNPYEFKNL